MGTGEAEVKPLKIGSLASSTEALTTVAKMIKDVVKSAKDISDAKSKISSIASSVLEVRSASALFKNFFRRVLHTFEECSMSGLSASECSEKVVDVVDAFVEDVEHAMKSVALYLARRIVDGDTIMTHSYSRTVLEAFKHAREQGKDFRVYVTEARPGGEGLLMAEKVSELGIDTYLIVDSAARYFMKEIDKVFIGCEAVAANGAVIAKVGTSLIASAAYEARVRVFVGAVSMKISPETLFGELIKLSEAPYTLLISDEQLRKLGKNVRVRAPLYDVTPPKYIDAIVTEYGLYSPSAITFLVREFYGWPPKLEL